MQKKYFILSARHHEFRVIHNNHLTPNRSALKGLTLHKYRKRSNYGSRHRSFLDKTFGNVCLREVKNITLCRVPIHVRISFEAIRRDERKIRSCEDSRHCAPRFWSSVLRSLRIFPSYPLPFPSPSPPAWSL